MSTSVDADRADYISQVPGRKALKDRTTRFEMSLYLYLLDRALIKLGRTVRTAGFVQGLCEKVARGASVIVTGEK